MKVYATIYICYLALALHAAADALAHRIWTDIHGRTLNAQFAGIESNVVSLKREDGHIVQIHTDYFSPEDRMWLVGLSSRSLISNMDPGKPKPSEPTPPLIQTRVFNMQAEIFSVSQRDFASLAAILAQEKQSTWSLSNGEASQDALNRFAAIPAKRSLGSIDVSTPFSVETRQTNKPIGDLLLSVNCVPVLGPDGSTTDLTLNVDIRDQKGNAVGHAISRIVMSEPGQQYLVVPDVPAAGSRHRRDAVVVLVTYAQ